MKTAHIILIASFIAATGCKNPADDVPEAQVNEAVQTEGQSEGTDENEGNEGAEENEGTEENETLQVTPQNSSVGFIGSKVTASEEGGFAAFSGSVRFDADSVVDSQITIEIDASSVFTEKERLTGHLRSDDFFDVENHPTASFVSTSIAAGGSDGATHSITGNLTLRGVSKSITFPATISVTDAQVRASAEFFINRQDFGIAYPGMRDDLIRDEVVIKLEMALPRR